MSLEHRAELLYNKLFTFPFKSDKKVEGGNTNILSQKESLLQKSNLIHREYNFSFLPSEKVFTYVHETTEHSCCFIFNPEIQSMLSYAWK